jgi:LEA14-like dessication related protein
MIKMATPKIEKRLWIAGLIGLVSVTGAYMYYQVNKILAYTLDFKGVKNVKFDNKAVSFTIWYEYKNKANINVTLAEQEYEVYINNQYLTTLTNFVPNTLVGSEPSIIDVNVKLTLQDFKRLNLNYAQVLLAPKSIEIKTIMKWKVKYGILKFPVKYPYILNLKEILGWYIPAINKL